MSALVIRLVQDTREQAPLDFSRWPEVVVEVGTLRAADYSLRGLEDRFGIERKSVSDLVGSVTSGRERLVRELEILRGFNLAVLVVEGDLGQVALHQYRSKASPDSVLQILAAWHSRYGVATIWAGTPAGAAYVVRSLARHYLREAHKRWENIVKAHGGEVA